MITEKIVDLVSAKLPRPPTGYWVGLVVLDGLGNRCIVTSSWHEQWMPHPWPMQKSLWIHLLTSWRERPRRWQSRGSFAAVSDSKFQRVKFQGVKFHEISSWNSEAPQETRNFKIFRLISPKFKIFPLISPKSLKILAQARIREHFE